MKRNLVEILHDLRVNIEYMGESYQQVEISLPPKTFQRLANHINEFGHTSILTQGIRVGNDDSFNYYGMTIKRSEGQQ